MTTRKPQRLETFLQHAGMAPFDAETGAAPVALPSMRTSTVRFSDLEALERVGARKAAGERAVAYGRMGMDTHAALESVFCRLEAAQHAFLAPSGMAAITHVFLGLLQRGDHVVVADCAYGPVRRLHQAVLAKLGIDVTYCAGRADVMASHTRAETRMLYVESPGSLLMEMLDLPALSELARARGVWLVTDNTWGAGGVYTPLTLGADVSIVAGTKYIGGHSDLMLGAVMVTDDALARTLGDTHYAMGYAVSADDAWLAIRGARTLALRLRQSAENGRVVADWLNAHAAVSRVFHPALPSDPGHALWRRDCAGSNGLVSFALDGDAHAARRVVNALQLFGIGFSWGGFESLVQLVEPQALAQHSYWGGGDHPVIRLYCGLESSDDLIDDLAQALAQAQAKG